MGRRWGKTVLGGVVSLATASQGGKVAWVVPEYRNGRPLWRWCESTVGPLKRSGSVSVNRSERTIEFQNGGLLGVYSADNPDSMRGEWFNLAVIEEAARVAEQAWTDVIQPTLADADGDSILISTPKGKNWFYHIWQAGQEPGAGSEYKSWRAPSRDNPNPRIKRAAEQARERVPEDTYRQEWEAEFIEGSGMVFRRIREAATVAPYPVEPYKGSFISGVDWGQKNDWTVITVMDAATRRVVDIVRLNKIDFAYQRSEVKRVHEKWGIQLHIVEANSIGQPNIELLVNDNIPVFPFMTTQPSKMALVQQGQVDFENGVIHIPDDPTLIAELEAYEGQQMPNGTMKYSAPAGMHDDCVMSLLLANYGASSRVGVS